MDLDQRVRQYYHAFDELVSADDLDGFMSTQAEDIVWNPPDRPAVVGHLALRRYARENWFDVYKMTLSSTVDEVLKVGEEYALARGHWRIGLQPKDGGAPSVLAGTFMWLIRTRRGKLRAARMMFSIFD